MAVQNFGKNSKRSNNNDRGIVKQVDDFGCWFKLMRSCLKSSGKASGFSGVSKASREKSKEKIASSLMSSTTVSNEEETTDSSNSNFSEELAISPSLIKFSYHDLQVATRNFKQDRVLGEGGFGRVFKGSINVTSEKGTRGKKQVVAVKVLNHGGCQGHQEWLTELTFLGELRHPNLVKLIGYCIEDEQRLLVYEFMQRGSLENHLFESPVHLPWPTRLKIMQGAANGLAFLHEGNHRSVIYRDLKTSNILLDLEYNAKLSDFGLAKGAPDGDDTHVSTRVMGTCGYAAPEYVLTGHLNSKSDVYSFGVVLLEILTGWKSMDPRRSNRENLVSWALPLIKNKKFEFIDIAVHGQNVPHSAIMLAHLATTCLDRDQRNRPSMTEVAHQVKHIADANNGDDSHNKLSGTKDWSSRSISSLQYEGDFLTIAKPLCSKTPPLENSVQLRSSSLS